MTRNELLAELVVLAQAEAATAEKRAWTPHVIRMGYVITWLRRQIPFPDDDPEVETEWTL